MMYMGKNISLIKTLYFNFKQTDKELQQASCSSVTGESYNRKMFEFKYIYEVKRYVLTCHRFSLSFLYKFTITIIYTDIS